MAIRTRFALKTKRVFKIKGNDRRARKLQQKIPQRADGDGMSDICALDFRRVGMARIDFFLLPDESLIIDEINTLPGFTPASMYPRLWQEAGVSYSNLVARLVDFALARHREKLIV